MLRWEFKSDYLNGGHVFSKERGDGRVGSGSYARGHLRVSASLRDKLL
jgi:hypothetical protein